MPPSQASATRVPGWFWFALPLMAAAWLRLQGVDRAEAFVDEGANILTALDPRVREAFEPLAQGRPGLIFLFKPAGWLPAHVLAVARVMTACAGLATLGALGWALQRLAGRTAALCGLWLWALLPIAVLHERLALQDPFVTALIAWALALVAGEGPARTPRWRPFFGAGLLLGAAILLKISAAFALPWLALLWWEIGRRSGWPRLDRRIGWLALGLALPLLSLGADLSQLGRGLGRYHALAALHRPRAGAALLDRLAEWSTWYAGYGDWPLLVLGGVAGWAAVRTRNRAALVCLAAWGVALLATGTFYNNIYARYLLPDHVPLVMFVAVAWASFMAAADRFRRIAWALFGLALAGWGFTTWQIGRAPERAAVPRADLVQYFTGPWSGRGLGQVRDYLTARAEREQARCLVLTHRFLRPGCYGLLLTERGDARIGVLPLTVYEPETLAAVRPELRRAAAARRTRFFLLYEGSLYPAHPWLDRPGSGTRRVLEVARGDGEAFTLFEFDVEPGP